MNALLIIDVQNDFLAGGSLAVPDGDAVVPAINGLQDKFDLVVATQDWHPPTHGSFAANHPGRSVYDVTDLNGLPQVLWPVHCVAGTDGAALSPLLDTKPIDHVVHKGTDPAVDSYSGFFDNGRRKATGLGEFLKAGGVDAVYLCGVATDYCVKATALDARRLGYATFLVADACRGVNVTLGDVDRAIAEMAAAGVRVVGSAEVP